jgi:hypothetical protein
MGEMVGVRGLMDTNVELVQIRVFYDRTLLGLKYGNILGETNHAKIRSIIAAYCV